MQVPGKLLVLATFAIGVALAGGAWWYNYQQSHRTAKFWGADAAALLVGKSEVKFLTLQPASSDPELVADIVPDVVTGRVAVSEVDLTDKPGLVHLRHALTYDANFAWDEQSAEPQSARHWAYGFKFSGKGGVLTVVFTQDFKILGRVDEGAGTVEVLPCPHLGPVVATYLNRVGIEISDAPAVR